MLRNTLCCHYFRNLIATIKDVYVGAFSHSRNIHKCAPCASQVAGHSPPDGLAVTDGNHLIEYLRNPLIKNVVVLAGAGISTPCGIPDFRTPGTGLYDNLQKYNLPTPEAIFDMDYFMTDPRPFFDLAKNIYPGSFKPGVAHYFVKLLDNKKKLLRMYTQNIDGLERLAGIADEKLVEAHGTFATATCVRCGTKYNGNEIKVSIFDDKIPTCTKGRCQSIPFGVTLIHCKTKTIKTCQDLAEILRYGFCKGIVKPDIVFFGEMMPDSFHLHMVDVSNADLMIIMGTSLVVHPFASLADLVRKSAPRLMINKDMVPGLYRSNDIFEQGDIDVIIPNLAHRLGWLEDLNSLTQTDGST